MQQTTRRGIVTGGSWTLDRNKVIAAWPQEDAATEILAEESRGGGSACNLAVDIRRLDPGLPVATIGLVGDDDNGRFLIAEADANGIERSQLAVTDAAPTFYVDAFCSRLTGRRTHIYNPGTGALLTPAHFDFSCTNARILHLGLPGVHQRMDAPWGEDANGWVTVLKQARAAGLLTNLELVSLSPARIAELVRPCLPYLDLLVVNDVEIGGIAGETCSVDGNADLGACIRAARSALDQGAMRLVAVHFPMGAVAVMRNGELVTRPSVAVPAAEIAGANGAGDAFAAGFLYGFHEGWDIGDALVLAHAAAAASLRGVSTTGTVESWQTCLALAKGWGTRQTIHEQDNVQW